LDVFMTACAEFIRTRLRWSQAVPTGGHRAHDPVTHRIGDAYATHHERLLRRTCPGHLPAVEHRDPKG
jgi:hypothetical protein